MLGVKNKQKTPSILHFALMAFGVYAATQVTYKATGKVTYDVGNQVLCTIVTKASRAGTVGHVAGAIPTAEGTFEQFFTSEAEAYTSVVENQGAEGGCEIVDQTKEKVGEEYPAPDFMDGTVIKIEVTVTNNNTVNGITIVSGIAFDGTAVNADCLADSSNATTVAAKPAEGTSEVTLTFYVWLVDENAAVESSDYTVTLTLTPATAA